MNNYLKDNFIDEVKGCLGKEGDGSGQANVIESIKVNGVDQSVDSNKSVDIPVPTKTSDLDNDSGYVTEDQVNNKVTEGVSSIVADAPEDFDTLKEMSDWLTQHDESAAAMNASIKKNADDITALQTSKADQEDVDEINSNLSDIVSNVTCVPHSQLRFKGDCILTGNRIKIIGEAIPSVNFNAWTGLITIPFSSVLDKRLNANPFYIDNDSARIYNNENLTANTSYNIDMEFQVNVSPNNRYLSLQNSILSNYELFKVVLLGTSRGLPNVSSASLDIDISEYKVVSAICYLQNGTIEQLSLKTNGNTIISASCHYGNITGYDIYGMKK